LGGAGVVPLETVVGHAAHTMAAGYTVNRRRKRPATYQLVEHHQLIRGSRLAEHDD